MKFKLIRGVHSQREVDPKGGPCDKCMGKGRITIAGKQGDHPCTQCYGTGKKHIVVEYSSRDPKRNIVESGINLEERFGYLKFQCIDKLIGSPDAEVLNRRIRELEAELVRMKESQEGVPTEKPKVPEQDLASMSKRDLVQYASSLDLDEEARDLLETCTTKDEIVRFIQSFLNLV